MCNHRDESLVLTRDGRIARVDTCISAIVQYLNDLSILTYDSCCGHGDEFGHITIGEQDAERARQLGFRICTETRGPRAAYPFVAVDHRINIVLAPVIAYENTSDTIDSHTTWTL